MPSLWEWLLLWMCLRLLFGKRRAKRNYPAHR
jgi:hypothetical protein